MCSARHRRISSPAHGFPQVLAVTVCVLVHVLSPSSPAGTLEKGAGLYRSSLVPGSKEHRDTLDYTFAEFMRPFPDDSISKSGIPTFNFILVAASLVLISCSVLEIRILKCKFNVLCCMFGSTSLREHIVSINKLPFLRYKTQKIALNRALIYLGKRFDVLESFHISAAVMKTALYTETRTDALRLSLTEPFVLGSSRPEKRSRHKRRKNGRQLGRTEDHTLQKLHASFYEHIEEKTEPTVPENAVQELDEWNERLPLSAPPGFHTVATKTRNTDSRF